MLTYRWNVGTTLIILGTHIYYSIRHRLPRRRPATKSAWGPGQHSLLSSVWLPGSDAALPSRREACCQHSMRFSVQNENGFRTQALRQWPLGVCGHGCSFKDGITAPHCHPQLERFLSSFRDLDSGKMGSTAQQKDFSVMQGEAELEFNNDVLI